MSTPNVKKLEKIFAANFRAWQGNRSNNDIAALIGCAGNTIRYYRSGERFPPADTLLAMAAQSGLPVEAFFSENMKAPPPFALNLEKAIREIVQDEMARPSCGPDVRSPERTGGETAAEILEQSEQLLEEHQPGGVAHQRKERKGG